MDPVSFLPWLAWFAVLMPAVVHLHELGHAAAALRLTRDSVVVQGCVRPVGALGMGRLHVAYGLPSLSGVCFHADAGRRRNAVIAAAGPLVSLLTGLLAGWAWCAGHGGTGLAAFALASLLVGVVNLLPLQLGPARGMHAAAESDGAVILRALGLARTRPADAPQPVIRAPFAVLLAGVAVLAATVSPLLLLLVGATAGHAWHVTRRTLTGR